MKKVSFFDKRILAKFWGYFSIISGIISFIYLFDFVSEACKKYNLWIGLLPNNSYIDLFKDMGTCQ